MCRRARARAKAAAMKTASFLKRCTVAACKCAVLAHATLAVATVATMTILQHHTTSTLARLAQVDHNTVQYLNTHVMFPWVVVGFVSLALSLVDSIVFGSLSYLKTLFKKTVVKRAMEEKNTDRPPRTNECKGKPPQKHQKHRLYPQIGHFNVLST